MDGEYYYLYKDNLYVEENPALSLYVTNSKLIEANKDFEFKKEVDVDTPEVTLEKIDVTKIVVDVFVLVVVAEAIWGMVLLAKNKNKKED